MKRLVCMPAVAILIAACATPLTPREQGAIQGAAIGMGIGAIAGSTSGHAGAGAVIGGVSGAVVGGVIGDAAQQRRATVPAPAPSPVVVARPVVVTPPPVVVTGTPTWILVPGTAVYYSPEIRVDVYLHGGIWYYRVNGVWFTGPSHVGPWERTPVTVVPVVVTRIPPGWRVKHGPPAVKHG
ncbi:MAG: glycine zipper domain-containing protein, partial [Candidatus Methylomirabilales bacterium]